MRPPSIITFERAYLASLAVGVVNTAINWQAFTVALKDPALQALGTGPGFMVAGIAVSMVISLLLWFFIARRASNIAKWIYLVFMAFGLLGIVSSLTTLPFGMQMMLSLAAQLLQFYAGWLLFRPDARAWFAGRWSVDARTFD